MLEAMQEVQLAADALRQMELTLFREVESLPVRTVGHSIAVPVPARSCATSGGLERTWKRSGDD